MNKEEILAKSRKENEKVDEMEQFAQAKAGKMAMGIGGVLCMVLVLLDLIRTGETNECLYAVYLGMYSVFHFVNYKGICKKSDLVYGILFGALAVLFLGVYVAEWVIG